MAKPAPNTFALSATVQWSSSAGGSTKAKVGRIVAVIPPGRRTSDIAADFVRTRVAAGTHRSAFGHGMDREHESYVVEVAGATARSKPVLYWPTVRALTLHEPHEDSGR
ncbi:hypothetical protein ACW0US_17545 [Xanthomonas euvesicatoria]